MATFVLLEGAPCTIGKKTYEKGDRISSDLALDKMFPGRWRQVNGGAALLASVKKKAADVPPPADEEPMLDGAEPVEESDGEADEEETEGEATPPSDDAEGEDESAVTADDVDVSAEFVLAAKKKVMVKLTPAKTYKLIDAETEKLLKDGLSKTDVKKFLKAR